MSIEIDFSKSVAEKINFFGRRFFIKRDDLLDDDFCGNKARKFLYFLEHDSPNIDTVASSGSSQSNAMHSLSVLAKMKNWKFIYYIDHLNSYLQQNPCGNFAHAIQNNMILEIGEMPVTFGSNVLVVNEGGAQKEAKFGIEKLANEIKDWVNEQKIEKLKIFLPSGTGTTALYLQEFLDFEVVTVPCVGDCEYLKAQFLELQSDERLHPTILKPSKKYHFANLYTELFETYQSLLRETGIEFDLLYDPVGWTVLGENLGHFEGFEVLYIHQGGLKGNATMKPRYERKLENKTKTKS